MSALLWKLRFVRQLRRQSRRGLSLRYCWSAAGAHLESCRGDLSEDARECAAAEFDACREACA